MRDLKDLLTDRALRLIEGHAPALLDTEPAGLFVMLRDGDGEVRGGMGTTEASGPVATILPAVAGAALQDPRHPPVEAAELEALRVELWILPEAPRRIEDAASIEPSRDVLRVRKGIHAATFLPDIAIARGWDAKASLGYACRKAGLPARAWQDAEAEVLAFRSIRLEEG